MAGLLRCAKVAALAAGLAALSRAGSGESAVATMLSMAVGLTAAATATAWTHARVATTTATAAELLVAGIPASARLPDREVGRISHFLLAFRTRQRCANQLTMHGSFTTAIGVVGDV